LTSLDLDFFFLFFFFFLSFFLWFSCICSFSNNPYYLASLPFPSLFFFFFFFFFFLFSFFFSLDFLTLLILTWFVLCFLPFNPPEKQCRKGKNQRKIPKGRLEIMFLSMIFPFFTSGFLKEIRKVKGRRKEKGLK